MVTIFWEKAMLGKMPKTKKMIPVLGVFKFDLVLSCLFGLFQTKRGWGEAKRRQSMREEK